MVALERQLWCVRNAVMRMRRKGSFEKRSNSDNVKSESCTSYFMCFTHKRKLTPLRRSMIENRETPHRPRNQPDIQIDNVVLWLRRCGYRRIQVLGSTMNKFACENMELCLAGDELQKDRRDILCSGRKLKACWTPFKVIRPIGWLLQWSLKSCVQRNISHTRDARAFWCWAVVTRCRSANISRRDFSDILCSMCFGLIYSLISIAAQTNVPRLTTKTCKTSWSKPLLWSSCVSKLVKLRWCNVHNCNNT